MKTHVGRVQSSGNRLIFCLPRLLTSSLPDLISSSRLPARRALMALLVALSLGALQSRSELILISEKQEIEIGREGAQAVEKEYGLYKGTPGLSEYVNKVGQRLVQNCDRKNITYYFKVADTPMINAFALPGGYVYVTRGILARLSSEDELAIVMGHELAHVTQRHGAQQMSKGMVAQLGIGLLGAFKPGAAEKYSAAAGTALGLAMLGYSRGMETEADTFGMTYAIKSGYNPRGAIKMFQMFTGLEGHEPSAMERFLLSHPPTKERLAYAEQRTAATAKQDHAFVERPLKRDAYLRRIEGLQLGQASGSRIIQGGTFYQKAHKLAFSFPDAYSANLNPQQGEVELGRIVRGQSGETQYVVGFEANAAAGAATADQYLRAYVGQLKMKSQERAAEDLTTDGGIPLRLRVYDLAPEKSPPLRIVLGAAMKGKTAYVLYGYTDAASFPQAKEEFRTILKSLRPLSDQEAASLKSGSLKLVAAKAGDTWASLCQREYGKPQLANKLAMYNGVYNPERQPEAGLLLKIPDKASLKEKG
jgi:predicted Zn-dependent protease